VRVFFVNRARLVFLNSARRFVGLVALSFFALPLGLSVIGCGHHAAPVVFCNAGDSGPVVGEVATITLSSSIATTGESLNYGQMGTPLSASAIDCKGNAVSVKAFTYSSTSSFGDNSNGGPIFADINPNTGQVCGGVWNRNTGGGIADFTTCTPPSSTPTQSLAFVTASGNGATSNAIPVYVHPVVTGVVLGPATPGAVNGSCPVNTPDPGTDCCPNDTVGTPVATPAGVVDGSKCISQNQVGQLVARIYANGNTEAANNITCQVGHLTFGAQTTGIVSIDQNGAATAAQPGSTTITATISNSSTATNAGFFSTCPPASITLADPSSASNSINVAVNTLQPLTATVLDTNGNVLTGLSLEYNSTTPQTIPAAVGSVTPAFPGSADITVVCQPGTCNPAPANQIGLYGGGKAITSNPITINTPGTGSTVLYMGSTTSDYVAFRDFTTNQTSTLIKLPFTPNSMVMNQAGTEIYLGSPQGLMSLATASNTVSPANQLIPGIVLSVSPDGSTLVVTDPTRQTISLVSASSNAVTTSYNGVGTSASWSPDDQAVYITTATLSASANPATITASPTITPSSTIMPSPVVLTHSTFTDWQTATADQPYTDVDVTVPSIGAFFAGAGQYGTEARSYCPSSTVATTTITDTIPNVNNLYIPLVAQTPTANTDQIAATTDGKHIIGAHANGAASTLSDIDVTLPLPPLSNTAAGVNYGCPIPPAPQPTVGYFGTAVNPVQSLTGINVASIAGVFPSTNSAAAFVTYTLAATPTTPGQLGPLLPLYFPPASGPGTLQFLTLGNSATVASAPVSGVFSTDNSTFYVGTGAADGSSADNDVHLITMTYPTSGAPTATEAPGSTITPQLPMCASTASGACPASSTGYAPVNLIAQHPKKTTT
jgi:trimeric autotransporter adhesin